VALFLVSAPIEEKKPMIVTECAVQQVANGKAIATWQKQPARAEVCRAW
jgi:hypothetical protein